MSFRDADTSRILVPAGKIPVEYHPSTLATPERFALMPRKEMDATLLHLQGLSNFMTDQIGIKEGHISHIHNETQDIAQQVSETKQASVVDLAPVQKSSSSFRDLSHWRGKLEAAEISLHKQRLERHQIKRGAYNIAHSVQRMVAEVQKLAEKIKTVRKMLIEDEKRNVAKTGYIGTLAKRGLGCFRRIPDDDIIDKWHVEDLPALSPPHDDKVDFESEALTQENMANSSFNVLMWRYRQRAKNLMTSRMEKQKQAPLWLLEMKEEVRNHEPSTTYLQKHKNKGRKDKNEHKAKIEPPKRVPMKTQELMAQQSWHKTKFDMQDAASLEDQIEKLRSTPYLSHKSNTQMRNKSKSMTLCENSPYAITLKQKTQPKAKSEPKLVSRYLDKASSNKAVGRVLKQSLPPSIDDEAVLVSFAKVSQMIQDQSEEYLDEGPLGGPLQDSLEAKKIQANERLPKLTSGTNMVATGNNRKRRRDATSGSLQVPF